MQTTNRPNMDALRQAIDIYRDAMRQFIVRQLKRVQGAGVEELIERALRDWQADEFSRRLDENDDIESALDFNYFQFVVREHWHAVFAQHFKDDMTVQNTIWVISNARNQIAHPGSQDIDAEYTRARLYDIADLLGRINVPSGKDKVEAIRDALSANEGNRVMPATPSSKAAAQTPSTEKRDGQGSPQRRSSNNLTPWRDVIRPNNDVATGNFKEAEFAADLQQVHDGRADATGYGNPVNFFNQTYITPGLRTLLVNTLKRLGGTGGGPCHTDKNRVRRG